MMACLDLFWPHFATGAGVRLGGVLPMLLGFGVVLWAIVRPQHRHEEALQEARTRESWSGYDSCSRSAPGSDHDSIPGGTGAMPFAWTVVAPRPCHPRYRKSNAGWRSGIRCGR
jgi:hypothetical protein